MSHTKDIVGSVFERNSTLSAKSKPVVSGFNPTGFPEVQHRSQSAFARNREHQRKAGPPEMSRLREVPTVIPAKMVAPRVPKSNLDDKEPVGDWREQISKDNERKVEEMTEEEREAERVDIMERFGTGIGDLLKRAREAKEKQAAAKTESASVPRPASQTDRKIRFADVTENDVHVYESAPPSPRRKALALPPPSDTPGGNTVSIGQWKGKALIAREEPEDGSPEDIRRRFFPNAPAQDPNLAWMEADTELTSEASSSHRFDLSGNIITPEMSSLLPTHLGLHHHAEGGKAGYTLDDIFLLSRSTVAAQRTTVLGILVHIAHKLGKNQLPELSLQSLDLRKRILAAGIEAMNERGSLGAKAVEVIWECVVGWDEGWMDLEGVEIKPGEARDASAAAGDAISCLPLEYLLTQITNAFATSALPRESLHQLLAITHRLALHSNEYAGSIVETAKLIPTLVQTFLLTPIPLKETSEPPNPMALRILTTLALSSRNNAVVLVGPADALLRYITQTPSVPSDITLLAETLRLYTALATYGLYSHIATTAAEPFAKLAYFIQSSGSTTLKAVWAALIEAWIVCAVDPHRTTPSHEILWSQVVGWGWAEDLQTLGDGLRETEIDAWAALWKAQAAWLEGSRVNGVKSGEQERAELVQAVKPEFVDGVESKVVTRAIGDLRHTLKDSFKLELSTLRKVASSAGVIVAATRLWLACLPFDEGPLAEPPLALPFGELSTLCAKLVAHPLWKEIHSQAAPDYAVAFCRPLTQFLSLYLRLSKRLPETTEDLWMAQAFAFLSLLVPGDEEAALGIIKDLGVLITPDFMTSRGWDVPTQIWQKGGMAVLRPFLAGTLRPVEDAYIGPSSPSPESIQLATTQRLPSASALRLTVGRQLGLPLSRDWTMSPVDHLLRSGSSSVFKALPTSWDASEPDMVSAALLLAKIGHEVLYRNGLASFAMTRAETVFNCMKVFMLEHGQPQNDSNEEVFRDPVVGRFMEDLLAPFTLASSTPNPAGDSLEAAALRFLGPSVPFYQYYTDFVHLYDAISFSHPLFARLLLPPTSMHYAEDYRKHLWNDFGHVLRTVRTPVEHVVAADLGEYLCPAVDDPQLLSAHLKALVKSPLDGFVRLVAVHNLASNIWKDLGAVNEDRAQRLLKAVVEQGSLDAVREVVSYHQTRQKPYLLLPACFKGLGEQERDERLASAEKWGIMDRIRLILKP